MGEATTADEALTRRTPVTKPDVAILDVRLEKAAALRSVVNCVRPAPVSPV